MACLDGQRCDAPCWGEEDGMMMTRMKRDVLRIAMDTARARGRDYAYVPLADLSALLCEFEALDRLRGHEAEAAMHCLCHVDADMSERVEVARALALAIGHPWPPYEDEEDEDEENACCVLALLEPTP